MKMLVELFGSFAGQLSLAVILFMIGMVPVYLLRRALRAVISNSPKKALEYSFKGFCITGIFYI